MKGKSLPWEHLRSYTCCSSSLFKPNIPFSPQRADKVEYVWPQTPGAAKAICEESRGRIKYEKTHKDSSTHCQPDRDHIPTCMNHLYYDWPRERWGESQSRSEVMGRKALSKSGIQASFFFFLPPAHHCYFNAAAAVSVQWGDRKKWKSGSGGLIDVRMEGWRQKCER